MRRSSSTSLCICTSLAVLVRLAEGGSSDFNSNSFNAPDVPSSQYLFTQQVTVDESDDCVNLYSETESLAFYSDTDEQTDHDSTTPSLVSSSLLYEEEGCLVSLSEALTCNGGDMFMDDISRFPYFDSDFEQESDDEDDDDDDDDDGHSSMLSNASLRRARATANGAPVSSHKSTDDDGTEKQSTSTSGVSVAHIKQAKTAFLTRNPALAVRGGRSSSAPFLARNPALAVRGGAASSVSMGSEFAKRLVVAALVTLCYEACLGHFFEFLKVVKQTSPPSTSYVHIIQSITAEKGIIALWDGFIPWGVIQAIFKGSVFGLAYAIASSILMPLADEGKIPKLAAMTLAGGIAGGFQGYVLSPTLLLKTRVMTNPNVRTTMQSLRIGFDVVANEGVASLMKGSNAFATKRVFDWSTRFLFADIISSELRKQQGGTALSTKQKISSDLLAGLLSTLVTLPLDVIVSKTQDAKQAGVSVSAWTLFQEELKESGWSGVAETYMSGFLARLAHVCCTTVAMKTGTAVMYDLLFGAKQT